MQRVLAALFGAALVLSGCAHYLPGVATIGASGDEQAAFFEGDPPTYGQQVSSADEIRLAYLRALRRLDVCGLVNQQSLARIGEIRLMGTLFAFDECDVEVKVAGNPWPSVITATVELAEAQGPEVLREQGIPVLESYPGACEYLVPLGLSDVPGASPLAGPEQPYLRVGMASEFDCDMVRRVASVVAARVADVPLPVRDGAAAYTTALAERDPCEILTALEGYVIDQWSISAGTPYRCAFGLGRDRGAATMPITVSLRPRVVDISTAGRGLIRVGDVEVYLDRDGCSALVFVGPDLQRRRGNGALVDTGDLRIRPAVDVAGGQGNCTGQTLVQEVAAAAADLFR
ncbi:MAG: hypothetical protein WBB07_10210 [Mycobacterium sp.]